MVDKSCEYESSQMIHVKRRGQALGSDALSHSGMHFTKREARQEKIEKIESTTNRESNVHRPSALVPSSL